MRCLRLAMYDAQVPDVVEVELDEHGRGCAVDTDIGRVKLGDLCTILWEYDEYGEQLQFLRSL